MTRSNWVFAVLGLMVIAGASAAPAATITPIVVGDFESPTVEDFQGTQVLTNSYDFANGMTYANLASSNDLINLAGTYGLGDEGTVPTGRGGAGDRYFGVGSSPQTFEFAFAAPGVSQFGFYGAEAKNPGVGPNNGQFNVEFYDVTDSLIGTATVTTFGTFAWDQFHGFQSDVPIGSVVFRDVGFMVLDDVHFGPVPEPGTVGIVGIAIFSLSARRRPTAGEPAR